MVLEVLFDVVIPILVYMFDLVEIYPIFYLSKDNFAYVSLDPRQACIIFGSEVFRLSKQLISL